MVEDNGNTFLPAYDTNGNVHGLITLNDVTFGSATYPAGSLVANYEYDAFGQTLREEGPYAGSNPFRYSTKYTDIETDLVYYGLRYYSPGLGRFINADPSEEAGGVNLYAFCGNNSVGSTDYLGMGEQDESSFYGVLYSPGHGAYDDFVAYANGGFGGSDSGGFSFSFSGGDSGYYLPSTARSGGTVFVGKPGPYFNSSVVQTFIPPDPAGVGNKTNTSQVRAIATPTGSTNVAGGANGPNRRIDYVNIATLDPWNPKSQRFQDNRAIFDVATTAFQFGDIQTSGAALLYLIGRGWSDRFYHASLQAAVETAGPGGVIDISNVQMQSDATMMVAGDVFGFPQFGAGGEVGAGARINLVGRTPGKMTPTGLIVQSRMRAAGQIIDDPKLGTLFLDSKGAWRPLADADMSHLTDAVTWWNGTGKYFGAKAPIVRQWMLEAENYILEYFGYNRSAGAKIRRTYEPPTR